MTEELKLEVGHTYVSRNKNLVKIDRVTENPLYPFGCSEYNYTQSGSYYRSGRETPEDLISEYFGEPAQATLEAPARAPHKWAAEMHAFADGYEIENFHTNWIAWCSEPNPNWKDESYVFRIKPEPAPLLPNVVLLALIVGGEICNCLYENGESVIGAEKAIRIDWNPNDQTLVSASVVTL